MLNRLRKQQPTTTTEDRVTDVFEPPAPLQTAVLFLVFNRPDTTAQVFEAIRKAQPPRLYVAADGPRASREREAERVAKVREIATAADWPCELKTLFREENLGCKSAVSGGITWFFEHEEQGIILEDDCLPHPDFFRYCEWCLSEFKTNPKVWHINGNNFAADRRLFGNHSISFVGLAQVWGWAAWADRWEASEKNVFYLTEKTNQQHNEWKLSLLGKLVEKGHLNALRRGLDTWDYQWRISILNARGLAISPVSNLVSNLGDGPDATHTKFDSKRTRLPVFPLRDFRYTEVIVNRPLTSWYERKMGLRGSRNVIKRLVGAARLLPKRAVKRIVQQMLFRGLRPVVVASSGRAGSTMMTTAVSESLVAARFSVLPALFQAYIRRLCNGYINRVADIEKENAPVLKTHDLFRDSFSDKANYIFVFGDPLESAQSVWQTGERRGIIWIEEHIYRLHGRGSPHELFQKDVLNYEAQLKSWGEAEGVFVVHYDDLWSKSAELSRFLGFKVVLPEKRQRSVKSLRSDYNKPLFDRLKQLELELRAKSA